MTGFTGTTGFGTTGSGLGVIGFTGTTGFGTTGSGLGVTGFTGTTGFETDDSGLDVIGFTGIIGLSILSCFMVLSNSFLSTPRLFANNLLSFAF